MMVCPSHECVRLKARTVSSPGRGVPRSVVKLNGSGIGIRWCSTTYLPVSRCQNVSESATSVEKQDIRRIAASATIAGRSQFGRAAGGLDGMKEKLNSTRAAAVVAYARLQTKQSAVSGEKQNWAADERGMNADKDFVLSALIGVHRRPIIAPNA